LATKLVEKLQSNLDAPLFDEQHALETSAVRVEDIQGVPRRLIQQHCREAFRRRNIAGVE
jgi:hypothetical protein